METPALREEKALESLLFRFGILAQTRSDGAISANHCGSITKLAEVCHEISQCQLVHFLQKKRGFLPGTYGEERLRAGNSASAVFAK